MKSFIFIICLCISIVPIIIYMILSMITFGRGLDTINKTILIKSIIDYAQSNPVPNNIKIINNLSSLPENIKKCFPSSLEDGRLYVSRINKENNQEIEIVFLLSFLVNGNKYISYQIIPEKEADVFIKQDIIHTIYILCLSAFIILSSIIILIKYLTKKILSPINTLETWVNNLSIHNVKDDIPYLQYPELYNIAKFIKSKLLSEYEYIKSEEDFWKFCSHEIRTPISVIRLGIEVLEKYISIGNMIPGSLVMFWID